MYMCTSVVASSPGPFPFPDFERHMLKSCMKLRPGDVATMSCCTNSTVSLMQNKTLLCTPTHARTHARTHTPTHPHMHAHSVRAPLSSHSLINLSSICDPCTHTMHGITHPTLPCMTYTGCCCLPYYIPAE